MREYDPGGILNCPISRTHVCTCLCVWRLHDAWEHSIHVCDMAIQKFRDSNNHKMLIIGKVGRDSGSGREEACV